MDIYTHNVHIQCHIQYIYDPASHSCADLQIDPPAAKLATCNP